MATVNNLNNKDSGGLIFIVMAVVAMLLAMLLNLSCTNIRHYKAVAADSTVKRTEQQKHLLALACSQQFPVVVRPGELKVDTLYTTNYEAINECYKLVDSLSKLGNNVGYYLKHDTVTLKQLVTQYIPKTKVIEKTRVDTVPDEAAIYNLTLANEIVSKDYAAVKYSLEQANNGKTSLKTSFNWFVSNLIKEWWFWLIVIALLGVGVLRFIKLIKG